MTDNITRAARRHRQVGFTWSDSTTCTCILASSTRVNTTPRTHTGEVNYNSLTFSLLGGEPSAPGTSRFTPLTHLQLPTEEEAQCHSQRKKKSFFSAGNRTPVRLSARNLVTVLTDANSVVPSCPILILYLYKMSLFQSRSWYTTFSSLFPFQVVWCI